MPIVDFNLYLITDRRQVPPGRSLAEVVRDACKGGVRAVQLREKDLPAADLLPLALELRAVTREYDARLLINDRIDVALATQADGVHLGGHSLPAAVAREILGPERLVGVSTHCAEEMAAAETAGADFVTFGPVYATPSKASYGPPVGLDRLREACSVSSLPVFALGGITAQRVPEVLAAGAQGMAMISAILAPHQPESAARAFAALMENGRH